MLDLETRASIESIGRYQIKDSIEVNCYRHWYFQFDLPPLPELIAKGSVTKIKNSIFVWEIMSVGNIIHSVPEKIKLYSPKFQEQVKAAGGGDGSRSLDERPNEHNIQDGEDANSNTKQVSLQAPAVGISFAKTFEVILVFKKSKMAQKIVKSMNIVKQSAKM